MRLAAALLLVAGVTGCAGRGPAAAPCERPAEPAAALGLKDAALEQHLRADARAAELLAVSYADAMDGVEKAGQHRQTMERCEAALLSDIARVHHVEPAQLRLAIGRQNDTPF